MFFFFVIYLYRLHDSSRQDKIQNMSDRYFDELRKLFDKRPLFVRTTLVMHLTGGDTEEEGGAFCKVLHPPFDTLRAMLHVWITDPEGFDDMGLSTNLLRGIYSYGFEKASAIQQRAIVPFMKGGDIIAQVQAGTGKTGAFAIQPPAD